MVPWEGEWDTVSGCQAFLNTSPSDKKVDDVYYRRPVITAHAGSDVMDCHQPTSLSCLNHGFRHSHADAFPKVSTRGSSVWIPFSGNHGYLCNPFWLNNLQICAAWATNCFRQFSPIWWTGLSSSLKRTSTKELVCTTDITPDCLPETMNYR